MIKLIIFDLDGTLYSESNLITMKIRKKAIQKVSEKNRISRFKSKKVYMSLGKVYPNPYEGLMSVGVSPDEYASIFNNTVVEKFISSDISLHHYLQSLTCKKVVLTLSPHLYAKRVLRALGISGDIDCLICVGKKGNYKKNYYFRKIKEYSRLLDEEICNVGNSYENDIVSAGKYNFEHFLISDIKYKNIKNIQHILDLQKYQYIF